MNWHESEAMIDFASDIEPLAEEFAERIRQGESVSVKEYIRRHPSLESQIRK